MEVDNEAEVSDVEMDLEPEEGAQEEVKIQKTWTDDEESRVRCDTSLRWVFN